MGGSLYNKIPLGRRKAYIRVWQFSAWLGSAALIGIAMLTTTGSH